MQTFWNGRGYQRKLFGRIGVTSANSRKEGVTGTDFLEGKGLPVQTGREGVTSSNSLKWKGLPVQTL